LGRWEPTCFNLLHHRFSHVHLSSCLRGNKAAQNCDIIRCDASDRLCLAYRLLDQAILLDVDLLRYPHLEQLPSRLLAEEVAGHSDERDLHDHLPACLRHLRSDQSGGRDSALRNGGGAIAHLAGDWLRRPHDFTTLHSGSHVHDAIEQSAQLPAAASLGRHPRQRLPTAHCHLDVLPSGLPARASE